MKVLVADDSLVMRRLLQATLESWSFEVVSAGTGGEALEVLLGDDPPRLAILDWIMPVFTGPEVCRRVRDKNDAVYTYLILLTSKSQREDIVEGLGSGADDYVVKPFDKHELEVRLRAARRILDLQNELMIAQEALREQATKDSLTLCWNRRVILEILEREFSRGRRENRAVGAVMMDLDHFKSINDTYGHAAGDEALRESVRRIQSAIRPYDGLGRYGGEEFLLVLPGCGDQTVQAQADRLRLAIESTPMLLDGQEVRVTASFGVSSTENASISSTPPLLRAADEALYEAKRTGRNKVVFHPPQNA